MSKINCIVDHYFGCFAHCGEVKLPIQVVESGEYYIVYDFKGTKQYVKANQEIGDCITFPSNCFNECAKISFQIIDGQGNQVGITKTVFNDCGEEIGDVEVFDFKLEIRPSFIKKIETVETEESELIGKPRAEGMAQLNC